MKNLLLLSVLVFFALSISAEVKGPSEDSLSYDMDYKLNSESADTEREVASDITVNDEESHKEVTNEEELKQSTIRYWKY